MASTSDFTIRRATHEDVPALGRLGGALLRTHYALDPLRFMAPGAAPDDEYGTFLATQLDDDRVAVFVAHGHGRTLGYIYVGLEPQSWKELREAAGFIHDVVVDDSARHRGLATALIEAAIAWLTAHGAPRVMLWTAEGNQGARRLFRSMGFRPTMVEMTRELTPPQT